MGDISIIDPSIQDPPSTSPLKSPRLPTCLTQNPEQRHSSPCGIFSFVMLHRVGRSFGTFITPVESLFRAFKSPRGFIHTKQRGRPKDAPHSLLTILNHIRPLKPLKWLSKAVLMIQHDQSILCNFLSIKQKRNCHMSLNEYKYSTSVKRARAIPFAISKTSGCSSFSRSCLHEHSS